MDTHSLSLLINRSEQRARVEILLGGSGEEGRAGERFRWEEMLLGRAAEGRRESETGSTLRSDCLGSDLLSPLTSCVTLNRSLQLLEPQLCNCEMGISTYTLSGLWQGSRIALWTVPGTGRVFNKY